MKFPLIKGNKNPDFKKRRCPVCHKPNMHEPNAFAFFNSGSLKPLSKTAYVPADDNVAFCNIGWHGTDDGGLLDITDMVPGGQFELYFCSTSCLRAFFNNCVDALEAKIK